MEAIIFIGIQGSGKSTFFRERLFGTHVRINLDMLKTKHRQELLLEACLKGKQRFAVDNTNITVESRAEFVRRAKLEGFRVAGYYFKSEIAGALERNRRRIDDERIPDVGIYGTYARLELPRWEEGFDELNYVRIDESGNFV